MTDIFHEIDYSLVFQERGLIRRELFNLWADEEPGTPEVRQVYRYNVETLSDGSRIYLKRPARMNNGADFTIFCENFLKYKNGNDKPPSHDDVYEEMCRIFPLTQLHLGTLPEFQAAVKRIWNCEDSKKVLSELVFLKGNFAIERLLLLIKWLFIEQDITYWNGSGRHMLLGMFK